MRMGNRVRVDTHTRLLQPAWRVQVWAEHRTDGVETADAVWQRPTTIALHAPFTLHNVLACGTSYRYVKCSRELLLTAPSHCLSYCSSLPHPTARPTAPHTAHPTPYRLRNRSVEATYEHAGRLERGEKCLIHSIDPTKPITFCVEVDGYLPSTHTTFKSSLLRRDAATSAGRCHLKRKQTTE